jgi:hypothetical protein
MNPPEDSGYRIHRLFEEAAQIKTCGNESFLDISWKKGEINDKIEGFEEKISSSLIIRLCEKIAYHKFFITSRTYLEKPG